MVINSVAIFSVECGFTIDIGWVVCNAGVNLPTSCFLLPILSCCVEILFGKGLGFKGPMPFEYWNREGSSQQRQQVLLEIQCTNFLLLLSYIICGGKKCEDFQHKPLNIHSIAGKDSEWHGGILSSRRIIKNTERNRLIVRCGTFPQECLCNSFISFRYLLIWGGVGCDAGTGLVWWWL